VGRSWGLQRAQMGWTGPRTWAAAQLYTHTSAHRTTTSPGLRTPEGKLRRGVSAGLVVSDQTQDLAEASHGQQTAVLRVCYLPYFAQYGRLELGALEELDGNLARDDAELLRVCLLEEILEDALLVGCEVEDGLVCACLACIWPTRGVEARRTQFAARREIRHGCGTCDGGARRGDGDGDGDGDVGRG
jgi:hypothetical protein